MSIVYLLDKAVGEVWADKEIDHLVNKYGVVVKRSSAIPYRVVALNAPKEGEPSHMTWRADCTIMECDYGDRFKGDRHFQNATRFYEGVLGNLVTDVLRRAIVLATGRLVALTVELNGIKVVVKAGDTVEERWSWMQAEQDRKHQAYITSPEYKEQCRLAEIKTMKHNAERAVIRLVSPSHMSLRDEAGWRKAVEVNKDSGYGAAVTKYAETWACFMEARLARGETVAGCADEMSHLADEEGITGFMYGCAVSILAQVWSHGEELRRWHNKITQIGTEGDKANETGGVLNPALLSIG